MRSLRVSNHVPATKGLAELNHHTRDELREVRDGATCNGQGLSEEDESRINEDVNGRRIELVQAPDILQRQHQQPQGPVVQWERFLPLRSLKVLLVENDDSTRHVVSALLRNCSYEVTAVENGLEAWKILVDLTKNIDLVLTEVVMPYMSGIGLLSKIMNHITCKNIPVIMMSSDDSMGIVFNCLSKGAVDFLVKPIRKNELKNLWQHVWRKCHSSSGSGSESGIRTQKSIKSRSIEGSDNDSSSNDEDDNRSIGLTAKDGSDNGSGTQSSWSKRAVEVDSSQAMSSWNQLVGPPDSTCGQVIHARAEAFSNYWAQTTTKMERGREDDKLDNMAMGKDLEIGIPRNSDLGLENPSKVTNGAACMNKDKCFESNPKKVGENIENESVELNSEAANDEPSAKAADLMGTITKVTTAQIETAGNGNSTDLSKKDKTIYHTEELPALELSLKRPRVGDIETRTQERNVLRHSGLSAFSRYNTTSNANQAPTGIVGSCSPVDYSSETAKPESSQNLHSNSNGIPNQRSNGSSNNDDMGSTTNNAFTKPEGLSDNKPVPRSSVNIHPCSAFQSINHDDGSSLQPDIPSMVDGEANDTVLTQSRALHQQVQVRHHHHHYHHHHHHVHNLKEMANHDDKSTKNMVSNVLTVSTEGNAANYGSASGSNNKSNGENGSSGQRGSSSAAIAEGAKMGSDNGVAGKCEAGDGSGSGSARASGVDQTRLAQREAALNKFRQKRKERCFEKKVRYQSRKRLAEQRPRVRGQFVRQGVSENTNEDADS